MPNLLKIPQAWLRAEAARVPARNGSTGISASSRLPSLRRPPKTTASVGPRAGRGAADQDPAGRGPSPKVARCGFTCTAPRPCSSTRSRPSKKAQPEFKHLTIAGGFRRGCEFVAEPGFSMTCFESAGGPKVASAGSTRPVGIVSGWGSRYAGL